jgi:hypothetical protein
MRFSSPAVVGLVTLIVYMLNAGPSFFWLDSSEFVAAAWELGVAHAPGHPLPSLLGYLFAQLPIGTIAFRVTLACAVQTALAAAVVTLIAKQLLARLREPSAPTPAPAILAELCAIAAGFVAGLSYALWFQAVRAEVYALNTLLLLVAVSLVLRYFETADRRHILAAALVYGLALCNHHLLALLALFPILLFIAAIHRAKRSGRLIVAIVAMGMLGLCTLAYLPLRAADNPRANWGNPQTIERFVFVVTAKSFQKSVERAAKQTLSERVAGAGFAVLGGLSPLGGLMALAGFYLAIRRRRSRAPALLLLTVAATNLISPVLVGFDPFNPDAHGYLSVAVAMLAPLIAVFLFVVGTTLAGTSPRRLQVASAGLTVAAFGLASMLVHINGRKTDLSQHYSAEETTRALLAAQPPGAFALYVLLRVDLQHLGDANQCWAEAGRHSRASKFFASTRLRGVARQAPPWPEARPFSLAQSGTIASGGVACVARDPTGLARIRSQYSARYRASFATSWADDAAVSASKNRVSPHSRASTRHRALERRHPPHRSSRNHAHAGLDAFSASPFVVRPWTAAVIRLSSAARSAARPTGSSLARVGQSVWLSATEKKRYRKPKNRRENGGWRLDVLGELGEPVSSSTRSPVRAGLRPVSGHFSAVIPCQGGAVYAVNI